MVFKITLALCFLLLLGVLCAEAQRDGRRRSGRRKPTTESPLPDEEPESEKNAQILDAEPEAVAKSSSAQPTESETKPENLAADKDASNQGGKPFILPRGTRKPRPQMRSNGEARPRPTLPTFARKRGPKPERRDFKKTDENAPLPSSTSTTLKPSRGSSRNRNRSPDTDKVHDRNTDVEKAPEPAETSTDASPKKRFGGGARRPSRGNRRYNSTTQES